MTPASRELIDKFAEEYTTVGKDVANMAAEFEAQLATKYDELKEEILYNTPEAQAEREAAANAELKSTVLDEVLQSAKNEVTTKTANKDAIMDDATAGEYVKALGAALEKVADTFIAGYTGTNLEADLKAYLQEYLNSSDRSKIADKISDCESRTSGSKWDYIDAGETETLKDYAKELLNAAIEQGLTVNLDGYSYTNAASLEKKIDSYTDGNVLMEAVNKFIDSLGTEFVKEAAQTKAISAAEAVEQAAFAAVKGEEYAVDATTIDYSDIPGYYENTQLHKRGKGWSGSLEAMQDEVTKLLNNESLKSQMRAQIETMLESKGISFDTVETIFENVYKQSILDTIATEGATGGLITGRGARGLSKRGHAYCNTADAVNTFITTFNTNIAAAINEMNASTTDMDVQDIDWNQAVEYFGVNADVQDAFENNDDYTFGGKWYDEGYVRDYTERTAEKLIDSLEPQLRRNVISMCNANGVEFDEAIFNTMFTNSKGTAISDGVSYTEHKGWLGILTKGYSSTFNPSTLMTTFVDDFKTDYTAWVKS